MTVQEYADTILTPAVLDLCGLPDTPDGREALNRYVAALMEDDA